MRSSPFRFNCVLTRLLIGDRLVRSQMSETSPGAAGLLADDGNVTIGNETPVFVAWLNTGQSTLMGR